MLDIVELIEQQKTRLSEQLAKLTGITIEQQQHIIGRYTAAFAVNLTDWLGKTVLWLRSPEARFAITHHLRDEQEDDSIGSLMEFADQIGCLYIPEDYRQVELFVSDIRACLQNVATSGLQGLVIFTVFKSTSQIFLDYLEHLAKNQGALDLDYIEIGKIGIASDVSRLLEALEAELKMDYPDGEDIVNRTVVTTMDLLFRIFSQD